MITVDADGDIVVTLGDPAGAGAGRIVAVDAEIIHWLERRRMVLERRARTWDSA
jgi:hypothetical protein